MTTTTTTLGIDVFDHVVATAAAFGHHDIRGEFYVDGVTYVDVAFADMGEAAAWLGAVGTEPRHGYRTFGDVTDFGTDGTVIATVTVTR